MDYFHGPFIPFSWTLSWATFMYRINPLSELLSTFIYCFYLCNVSRIEWEDYHAWSKGKKNPDWQNCERRIWATNFHIWLWIRFQFVRCYRWLTGMMPRRQSGGHGHGDRRGIYSRAEPSLSSPETRMVLANSEASTGLLPDPPKPWRVSPASPASLAADRGYHARKHTKVVLPIDVECSSGNGQREKVWGSMVLMCFYQSCTNWCYGLVTI